MFSKQAGTERIDLPGGEWVEVKRRPSRDDRDALTSAAMRVKMAVSVAAGVSAPEMEMGADLADTFRSLNFTALFRGIVAWSSDLPLTPANILDLDEESYDVIATRIDELWKGRTEEEKKGSYANGRTASLVVAGESRAISGG